MKTVIYDNYDLMDDYEEAASFLRKGREDEPSEYEIMEELNDEDRMNWETAREELDSFFAESDTPFLLIGTVGRWNGPAEGGFVFSTFDELWGRGIMDDCAYVRIWDEDGHLYLEGSHHDGDNHFEIRRLTDKGLDEWEEWRYDGDCSERDIHRRIWDNSDLSELPCFAKTMYGVAA